MVECLLESPHCDPNLPTRNGESPLDLAYSSQVIRVLLEKGATPSYYNMEKCFPDEFRKDLTDMAIKIFVVGDPGTGKSTLVKSIQTEAEGFGSRFLNQISKVKNVDEKTAGIIPHDTNTKSLGRVTLYDFAGHREFYAGHDAVLRTSIGNSESIVVLVVNMRDEEAKIKEVVEYWFQFLAQQSYEEDNKPHMLIVGSHADLVSSINVSSRSKFLQSIVNNSCLNSFASTELFMLDCRYAERSSMSNLRKKLSDMCRKLRSKEKFDFPSHCLLVFLLDKFRDAPAITLASVEQEIRKSSHNEKYRTWMKSLDLASACERLNKQGSVLLMKSPECVEKCWIILNKPVLLSRVNGKLFAPEKFKEHQNVATNTGLVTLSSLSSLFSDLNPNMICRFLCHLEFCQEIKDPKVLKMLQSETKSYCATEQFFFFPALVCLETPTDVWQHGDEFSHHTGWIIRCSKTEQFLTTRFSQVLLLRLAFQFALIPTDSHPTAISIQRQCSVWKNGISWANQSSGEAIVEVDQKQVVVMTRSKQMKLESVNVRSRIIHTVLLTKHEFCPKVQTEECLIYPEDVVHFPTDTNTNTVSIKDVALTVKEGKSFIVLKRNQTLELDKLLHFEAYSKLNEQILQILFDRYSPQHHQKISMDLIHLIAEHAHVNTDEYITICKPSPWQLPSSGTNPWDKLAQALQQWKEKEGIAGSPCDLHNTLDQFSVFAGRNPLQVCEGSYIVDACSISSIICGCFFVAWKLESLQSHAQERCGQNCIVYTRFGNFKAHALLPKTKNHVLKEIKYTYLTSFLFTHPY